MNDDMEMKAIDAAIKACEGCRIPPEKYDSGDACHLGYNYAVSDCIIALERLRKNVAEKAWPITVA